MNNENENQDEGVKSAESKSLKVFKDSAPALAPSTDDFSSIANVAKELDNMLKVAEIYVNGGLSPIKKKEDFVVAVVTGNQLGLPFTVSINNIFPINGKPAMSVHLIRALLLKKGVTFDKTKDYVAIHQFFQTEPDGDKRKVKLNAGGKPILAGIAPYNEINQDIYFVNPQPSDYVTEYVFSRLVKQINGAYKEQKSKSSFSITDAQKADLLEKDNWKKYPQSMLDARAFMKGAREVASDIIFGLYSVDELADANNVQYTMDDSMNQTVIDAEIVR